MPRPRFCPHPNCLYHRDPPPNARWYHKHGSHPTATFGSVQRYRCTRCTRTFSDQTFSIDYWLKRKISYQRICSELVGCSSTRHMSRVLGASCDSIQNRIGRLSRNALVMQEKAVADLTFLENLASDGFVSFTESQYHPHHIHTLMGSVSQFAYFWNEVTVRRTGRMTPAQKAERARRELIWKPIRDGITHSFTEIYNRTADLVTRERFRTCIFDTDEHRSYIRAFRKSASAQHLKQSALIIHRRTPSTVARTRQNPLFPVNYIDREIRKDLKNHVRETVCFARNQNNMMHRVSLYLWHHNFCKSFRIRDKKEEALPATHAEAAGIPAPKIQSMMRGFFTQRAFFSRSCVSGSFKELWLNRLLTPMKPDPDYCQKHLQKQVVSHKFRDTTRGLLRHRLRDST